MHSVERGMTAWSLAGHDRGKLYVIIRVDEEYAWICDGRLRKLENPKKKKWKHIQVRKKIPQELETADWDNISNEEIKRAIRAVNQEVINVKSRCD